MALIERLMHLEEPNIPTHGYFAACFCQTSDPVLMTHDDVVALFAMDGAAADEHAALITKNPAQKDDRALWLESLHSIFIMATGIDGQPVKGFTEPDDVRAKLGLFGMR